MTIVITMNTFHRKVIVTGSENDKSNKNLKYAYKVIIQ